MGGLHSCRLFTAAKAGDFDLVEFAHHYLRFGQVEPFWNKKFAVACRVALTSQDVDHCGTYHKMFLESKVTRSKIGQKQNGGRDDKSLILLLNTFDICRQKWRV